MIWLALRENLTKKSLWIFTWLHFKSLRTWMDNCPTFGTPQVNCKLMLMSLQWQKCPHFPLKWQWLIKFWLNKLVSFNVICLIFSLIYWEQSVDTLMIKCSLWQIKYELNTPWFTPLEVSVCSSLRSVQYWLLSVEYLF